jgi:alanine-glyoxylate transaminase/serine-glyoxylate transaminase/serine-pyruvate transaminase
MGDLNDLMVLGALGGVEMAMSDAGIQVEFGSGVGAAAAYYQRTARSEKVPAAEGSS